MIVSALSEEAPNRWWTLHVTDGIGSPDLRLTSAPRVQRSQRLFGHIRRGGRATSNRAKATENEAAMQQWSKDSCPSDAAS